jgi:hypothetical protein
MQNGEVLPLITLFLVLGSELGGEPREAPPVPLRIDRPLKPGLREGQGAIDLGLISGA